MILQPVFASLTYLESDFALLPEVCVYFSVFSGYLNKYACIFWFLVRVLVSIHLFLQVFPILRGLFRYYRDVLHTLADPEVRKIVVIMCNDLYVHTLFSDYGNIFGSAYLLSKQGAEEHRAALAGQPVTDERFTALTLN
jgi:hypothetical protein